MKLLIASILILGLISMKHPMGFAKFFIEKDCRTSFEMKNDSSAFILFDNILAEDATLILYMQKYEEQIDTLRVRGNILVPYPKDISGVYTIIIKDCNETKEKKILFIN